PAGSAWTGSAGAGGSDSGPPVADRRGGTAGRGPVARWAPARKALAGRLDTVSRLRLRGGLSRDVKEGRGSSPNLLVPFSGRRPEAWRGRIGPSGSGGPVRRRGNGGGMGPWSSRRVGSG